MRTWLLTIVLIGLIGSNVSGQQQFQKKNFAPAKGDTLRYQVLFPASYSAEKKYPLIIFLHGSGERADDNMLQMKHGSKMFTNPVNMEKYPAIVLFPQCPANETWIGNKLPARDDNANIDWSQMADAPIAPSLEKVKELVDYYIANEKVDPKRIYIMGLSMGGMGTFDLVARYPDLFAAAIPICGGVYTPRLKEAAKTVKFRIYHGDADQTVSCNGSRQAYLALKEYGATVSYFEFPGVEHNSWNPAFNQPDFFEWLFKQKRKK